MCLKLLFKDTKMRQNTVFAPEFPRFVSFFHRFSSKSVLWPSSPVSPSSLRSWKSAQGGRKQPFFLHLCCHHLLFQLFLWPSATPQSPFYFSLSRSPQLSTLCSSRVERSLKSVLSYGLIAENAALTDAELLLRWLEFRADLRARMWFHVLLFSIEKIIIIVVINNVCFWTIPQKKKKPDNWDWLFTSF